MDIDLKIAELLGCHPDYNRYSDSWDMVDKNGNILVHDVNVRRAGEALQLIEGYWSRNLQHAYELWDKVALYNDGDGGLSIDLAHHQNVTEHLYLPVNTKNHPSVEFELSELADWLASEYVRIHEAWNKVKVPE